MQMLYSLSKDSNLTFENLSTQYRKSVDRSYELFTYNLLFIIRVAEYSRKEAQAKSSKHLPSDEDKAFSPILFENELVQSMIKNEAYEAEIQNHEFEENLEPDTIRNMYIEFSKKEDYIAYIKKDNYTLQDHKAILLSLYKCCTNSESFDEEMEDKYFAWTDDKSLIIGTMKKTLKALPATPGKSFTEVYRPTKETVEDFGIALLKYVVEKDEELLGIISPSLKNWDADRVAIIDMICLKMAISELMIFPTIPTKVTLNEFVEISKVYSTDKSKDFINGVLDRLMKKLDKDGRITKEGRGLVE